MVSTHTCLLLINFMMIGALFLCMVLKYRATRDSGFLFLLLALVLWPMWDGFVGYLHRAYLEGTDIVLFGFRPTKSVERDRLLDLAPLVLDLLLLR